MKCLLSRSAKLFLALGLAGQAMAGPPVCSCANLEQLQQEYQNAVYLEGFMRQVGGEIKQWELDTQAEKDQGLNSTDIRRTSVSMFEDKKARRLRLPFPEIEGYSGPPSVNMTWGTCYQEQRDLDALEAGSQCEAIADMALAHELGHRDICNQLGAEAYWARNGSAFALEEAERYKRQAANLKAEIGRVLDASQVRLRGEWMHVLSGDGAEFAYFYSFDSGDMSLTTAPDGLMSFTGEGTTSNQIISVKAPGVSCTSTGAVTNRMVATLTTDGMTFGVDLVETNTGGDLILKCDRGGSIAMPSNDVSSGTLAAGLPLKMGDTMLSNAWAETIRAVVKAAGMSLTGEPTTSVSITCEAP